MAGFATIARGVTLAFLAPAAVFLSLPASAADDQACNPADQLPCACRDAGVEGINQTVTACFVGDINRQTPVQTDSFGATAFAALNWPLDVATGAPDYAATPAGDYTTVLDGWKSTRDILRHDMQAPEPWDSHAHVLPRACQGISVEEEIAKVAGGDKIPHDLPPRLLDEYINPKGNALIDASGQPVRYEVLMNRQAYDYINDNELWDPAALDAFLDAAPGNSLDYPRGHWPTKAKGDAPAIPETRGAIVAKAAWKILDPKTDDFDQFHKSWAYVTPVFADGAVTHDCALKPVGLVGLHISYKLSSLPDWLWTTFEHKAVAPLWSEVGASALPPEQSGLPDWLFYTPYAEGAARLNRPAKDPASGAPTRILRYYPAGYYYPPLGAGAPPDCATSMEFRCFNERLHDGLKGAAAGNYILIGTQWRRPANQGSAITPEILGNAALESFTQDSSSCVACHSYAAAEEGKTPPRKLDHIFALYRDVLKRNAPQQSPEKDPYGN